MIREERDPAFWERIVSHPSVVVHLHGVAPDVWAQAAVEPSYLPLAAEHGGFVFIPRDAFGRVVELHTVFTPEGWGREVATAAKAAFNLVFESHDAVVTYERLDEWRSRPPRSFGFSVCGEGFEVDGVTWRTWMLSRQRWRESPAFERNAAMLRVM